MKTNCFSGIALTLTALFVGAFAQQEGRSPPSCTWHASVNGSDFITPGEGNGIWWYTRHLYLDLSGVPSTPYTLSLSNTYVFTYINLQNRTQLITVHGNSATIVISEAPTDEPEGHDSLSFELWSSAPPGFDQLIPVKPTEDNDYATYEDPHPPPQLFYPSQVAIGNTTCTGS